MKSTGMCALGAAVAASALLAMGCVDPKDQRPGLYLSGEVVEAPVDDWSFSDSDPEIYLETRAWYLLPHSVAVNCGSVNGKLYVGSIYRNRESFPEGRAWNRNVMSNPHVRLEIGDKIYRANAVQVTDPEEARAALEALGRKHPQPWGAIAQTPEGERIPTYFFRMDPRS